MESKWQCLVALAREKGIVRASDTRELGVNSSYLTKLAKVGRLERVGRGLYTLPNSESITVHHSLVEVSAYAPKSVVCLLSALTFHGIGTQLPHAVWIAIPTHAAYPKITTVPIEVVQMSPRLFGLGAESHLLEGVAVYITSPVKTVVDCFRYRSRIGLDVAIEALKDSLTDRRFSVEQLHQTATVAHMWEVIRPYLEASL